MTSEYMDAPKRRVYISLPKKYMSALGENYELEHGVLVRDLNPYLNEGYLQAYFREWGTVTTCKMTKDPSSEENNMIAYVRFSLEAEADRADWAGPHFIGGNEVKLRRVVSPKMEEDDAGTVTVPDRPRPRRSMGLGYIFEDAQWLDNELDK